MVLLQHWILLSLLFFSLGIYGVATRRSAVGVLISVELMLNAGALNFVAFSRFVAPGRVDGQVMAVFVMALAAAEVLVGLAILLLVFRTRRSVDVTRLHSLSH